MAQLSPFLSRTMSSSSVSALLSTMSLAYLPNLPPGRSAGQPTGCVEILGKHHGRFPCLVRTAHERTGCNVTETELHAFRPIKGKLVRRDVLDQRHVTLEAGRLQVLTDGEEIDVDGAQVAHGFDDFVGLFTHADEYGGLGPSPRIDLLDHPQDVQRLVVAGASIAHLIGQSPYRF